MFWWPPENKVQGIIFQTTLTGLITGLSAFAEIFLCWLARISQLLQISNYYKALSLPSLECSYVVLELTLYICWEKRKLDFWLHRTIIHGHQVNVEDCATPKMMDFQFDRIWSYLWKMLNCSMYEKKVDMDNW